jgi:endonuclease YncB( thermonuclease family)
LDRVVLPLLVLLALLALAPSAQARQAPCRVDGTGPACHVWTGKVTHVADGDGVYVDIAGDGTRRDVLVRMTGLNAMELTRYSHTASKRRGACHAKPATAALERLVRRRTVRLAAMDLGRTDLGRRLRRHLAVRIDGRWVDAAEVLLAQGHALWLPNSGESAWNTLHHSAALRGAATGRHLFDPQACGAGPGGDLTLSVNWDADGNDGENLNGEYVRVRNPGSAPVDLGGWWIRDSALRRATFPAGARVDPGASVLLRVGRGNADGRTFYWGLAAPAFENSGDGAYLFDPQGDLRAHEIYP